MIRALVIALLTLGCEASVPAIDAAPSDLDAAVAGDAPATDAPARADGPILCTDHAPGACSTMGEICWCCPGGTAGERNCLCSRSCNDDGDCTDPERPSCTMDVGSSTGFCVPRAFVCCWDCT